MSEMWHTWASMRCTSESHLSIQPTHSTVSAPNKSPSIDIDAIGVKDNRRTVTGSPVALEHEGRMKNRFPYQLSRAHRSVEAHLVARFAWLNDACAWPASPLVADTENSPNRLHCRRRQATANTEQRTQAQRTKGQTRRKSCIQHKAEAQRIVKCVGCFGVHACTLTFKCRNKRQKRPNPMRIRSGVSASFL